jgi:hypothetical protein
MEKALVVNDKPSGSGRDPTRGFSIEFVVLMRFLPVANEA